MDLDVAKFSKTLCDFISKNKKKIFYIVPHEYADIDSVSSAVILRDFISRCGGKAYIVIHTLNSQSKKLYDKFPFTYISIVDIDYTKGIFVIVDVSDSYKIPLDINKVKDIIIIDHHKKGDLINKSRFFIVKEYTSSARLCYEIYSYMFPITKSIAIFVIAGILSDTGFLRFSHNEDLNIVSFLVNKFSISLKEFSFVYKSFEEVPKDIKISALKRLSIFKVQGKWCGFSFVGTEEAKISNLFLQLGFDISIVVNHKSKRISIRYNKKDLNFDIFKDYLKHKGYLCGGHEGVFGCKYNEDKTIEQIRGEIKEAIKEAL